MNIEKEQTPKETGEPGEPLFVVRNVSIWRAVLVVIGLLLLVSEAYYRFRLFPGQGLENVLGPAGLAAIILVASCVLQSRSDGKSRWGRLRRLGVSTMQRITVDDHGLTLRTGDLGTNFYAWTMVEKLSVQGDELRFHIPAGGMEILSKVFTREEREEILAIQRRKKPPA